MMIQKSIANAHHKFSAIVAKTLKLESASLKELYNRIVSKLGNSALAGNHCALTAWQSSTNQS